MGEKRPEIEKTKKEGNSITKTRIKTETKKKLQSSPDIHETMNKSQ